MLSGKWPESGDGNTLAMSVEVYLSTLLFEWTFLCTRSFSSDIPRCKRGALHDVIFRYESKVCYLFA